MMNCHNAERLLAGYLDGAISLREHAILRVHLDGCENCRQQLEKYRRLAVRLASVTSVSPPASLATQIRLRAARSISPWVRIRRSWSRKMLAFEEFFKPLAVPATGGILTALIVFVFVVQNVLVGVPMGFVANDLPLNLVQPARLERLAPFPISSGATTASHPNSGELLVEATLNAQGEVVSYQILSGPDDIAVQHQVDQVLLFSRFRPEVSFGRPTAGGRVLLSFSEVRVRG
jgi:hypothetical protein